MTRVLVMCEGTVAKNFKWQDTSQILKIDNMLAKLGIKYLYIF